MGPNQVPPAFGRLTALDGYRFLAAACVVIYHYNLDFGLNLQRWSQAPVRFYIMVDFFFLLSGFVIAAAYGHRLGSWRQYGTFLHARIARLYPLHLLTLSAVLALYVVSRVVGARLNNPEIFDFSALPANLLLIHAWGATAHNSFNVPSWSISSELFVYLCAPAFIWIASRIRLLGAAIAAGMFIAALALVRSALGLGPWYWATYDLGALRAVPTFFFGVAMAQFLAARRLPLVPRWWMAHCLFLAALACAHFALPIEASIIVFSALIAVTVECERSGQDSVMRSKTMQTLGDASYAIYMLHVICAIPVLFVTRKLGLIGTPWAVVIALTTFGCVVVLSIAVFHRFEVPARRWVMGWGRKVDPKKLAAGQAKSPDRSAAIVGP